MKETNKITLQDVVRKLQCKGYEAYEIPKGISIANIYAEKEEYMYSDIQDGWNVIHTGKGVVIECKSELTDKLIDNLDFWAFKLPRSEFVAELNSSDYKTDLPDEKAFEMVLNILNTKGYKFHAVEIENMKYAIGIDGESHDVIDYLRYMKLKKWPSTNPSRDPGSCVIASDEEHPDMSELIYWAKSLVSKEYFEDHSDSIYSSGLNLSPSSLVGSFETDNAQAASKDPHNPFGLFWQIQGGNFNAQAASKDTYNPSDPFGIGLPGAHGGDPFVPQYTGPVWMLDQNTAIANSFSPSASHDSKLLEDLFRAIDSTIGITKDLDVDKVKTIYGSCKQALSAIIYYYRVYKANRYLACNIYNPSQQLNNCGEGGANMAQFGVITEQGDLGLGYDPLNEKDNKVVNESVRSSMNKTKENENDEK